MLPKDGEPKTEPLPQPLQALLTSIHSHIWEGEHAGRTQVAIATDSDPSSRATSQGIAIASPIRGRLILFSFIFSNGTRLTSDDLYAFAQKVAQPGGISNGSLSMVEVLDRHERYASHADGIWANNMGVGQAIADVTNDKALPQMEVTLKGHEWQATDDSGNRQEILEALCEPPTGANDPRLNPRSLNAFTLFDLSGLNIPRPSNS